MYRCVAVYWCFGPLSSRSSAPGLLNLNNEGMTFLRNWRNHSHDIASRLRALGQHRYKNLQSQRSSINCSLFCCVHTAMVAAQKPLPSRLQMVAMTAPCPLQCQCSWFLSLLGFSPGPSRSLCPPFWLWLQSFCTVASDTLLTLHINTHTHTCTHIYTLAFARGGPRLMANLLTECDKFYITWVKLS